MAASDTTSPEPDDASDLDGPASSDRAAGDGPNGSGSSTATEVGKPASSRRRRVPTFVVLVAGFVLLIGGVGFAVRSRVVNGNRPNVLVIMTDDQTLESMRVMPIVKQRLTDEGTSYTSYYTTTPNCCPSRAGYYSGRYPHNNGVHDNIGPAGGAKTFIPDEGQTVPVWMQEAGYYTAHIGKYLNGWGDPKDYPDGTKPRPGWTHWFGLVDPSTYNYFDYQVSDDGNIRTYGRQPEDYQTDVLGAEVLRTIDRAGGQPWFISFTPLAPHVGAAEGGEVGSLPVPAQRHAGTFKGAPGLVVPSLLFNSQGQQSADVQNKPPLVRSRVEGFPVSQNYVTEAYRAELETLQAVDEWVGKIYQTLEAKGQLDNTVIIFTSDNGLFHGEHGLMQKNLLYEEAVHLPLVVRGPGFPRAARAAQMSLNLDLAPTILSIAGLEAPVNLDGRDLAPLAADPAVAKDRAILMENFYPLGGEPAVHQVRVDRWSYTEWKTDKELYDLQTDPFQMRNLAADPAYRPTIEALHQRLVALASCSGSTCEDSDASRR